jgi:hypothetical protein
MSLSTLRLLSLLFTGLAITPPLAHLFELPNKTKLYLAYLGAMAPGAGLLVLGIGLVKANLDDSMFVWPAAAASSESVQNNLKFTAETESRT